MYYIAILYSIVYYVRMYTTRRPGHIDSTGDRGLLATAAASEAWTRVKRTQELGFRVRDSGFRVFSLLLGKDEARIAGFRV